MASGDDQRPHKPTSGTSHASPVRIALLSDFGAGPYVGQMQLVLSGMVPDCPVIPLIADLPAFRADLAGYLLAGLAQRMPGQTLYACVVDPGVGTDRDVLIACCGDDWWLAPDNGLLVPLLATQPDAQVYRLRWRPAEMSASFHGRDLFMPLAARLVRGERPACEPVEPSALVNAHWPADAWKVCYIDAFGNLMTGVDADRLAPTAIVRAGDHHLRRARTFADVGVGEAFWYRNAFGLVELAVNQGRADAHLGLGLGAAIAAG